MSGSEATDDVAMKRCEDIILSDRTCRELTVSILSVEAKLKGTLTEAQLKLFQKYDNLVNQLKAHESLLIYNQKSSQ